jgi:hypothetical protein
MLPIHLQSPPITTVFPVFRQHGKITVILQAVLGREYTQDSIKNKQNLRNCAKIAKFRKI